MSAKTTGAEFKRFYNDPEFWPEDDGHTWHDDVVLVVDGVRHASDEGDLDYNTIVDSAKVVIECGMVFGPALGDDGVSLDTYYRRWAKKQTTSSLVVEVPNDKREAVEAAIRAAGGKIVR